MGQPQQYGMPQQQPMTQANLSIPSVVENPKKTQLMDKVDVLGSDIAMSAESSLNNLIDLKTHLRNTNN